MMAMVSFFIASPIISIVNAQEQYEQQRHQYDGSKQETTKNLNQKAIYSWDRNHYSLTSIVVDADTNINIGNGADNTQDGDVNLANDTHLPGPTLIIQSLPPGAQEELLAVTSRVNRAYAKRWGFDYLSYIGYDPDSVLLRGLRNATTASIARQLELGLGLDFDVNANTTEADANNVTDANDSESTGTNVNQKSDQIHVRYETIMFLQSDAVIVELDYNILDLIQSTKLVACGVDKAKNDEEGGLWTFYSSVLIWNLNHPSFGEVSDLWLKMDGSDALIVDATYHDFNSNTEVNTKRLDRISSAKNLAKILMEFDSIIQSANTDQNLGNNLDGISTTGDGMVEKIPKKMVNGVHGTVIKQYDYDASSPGAAASRNIRKDGEQQQEITNDDLPWMIPIIQGISDNVCYRYYPECEVVY